MLERVSRKVEWERQGERESRDCAPTAAESDLTLQTVNKRIAPSVEKAPKSATANARNSGTDVDVDNLVVSEAYVNEGPRQKRVRPAPMGRAYRYQRRSAHIVIQLAEKGVTE